MPLSTDQPVAWESLNAKLLKDFLLTPTGERAIASVLFEMPIFVAGPDAHATLVSACVREGYQRAVNALINLTHEQPEQPAPVSTTYPSIDDDASWKDEESNSQPTD